MQCCSIVYRRSSMHFIHLRLVHIHKRSYMYCHFKERMIHLKAITEKRWFLLLAGTYLS